MKMVQGSTTVQVWTEEGRLRVSFPTTQEAAAWLAGYTAAVGDLTEVIGRTFQDLTEFLSPPPAPVPVSGYRKVALRNV